jgi:hypothetical protein
MCEKCLQKNSPFQSFTPEFPWHRTGNFFGPNRELFEPNREFISDKREIQKAANIGPFQVAFTEGSYQWSTAELRSLNRGRQTI